MKEAAVDSLPTTGSVALWAGGFVWARRGAAGDEAGGADTSSSQRTRGALLRSSGTMLSGICPSR